MKKAHVSGAGGTQGNLLTTGVLYPVVDINSKAYETFHNHNSSLETAINAADLPALVNNHYPDCGARPSSKRRARAVWRGGNNLSVSFWRDRRGAWRLTDHAIGETYTPFTFLTEIAGYSKQEARRYLLSEAGVPQTTPRRAAKPHKQPDSSPKTAHHAIKMWQSLPKQGSSPYLERKQANSVHCDAIRYDRGRIGVLMSVVSDGGILHPSGVQWIYKDGFKKFADGSGVTGALALVGASALHELRRRRVWVCEGLATGLSVYAATNEPVVLTFSSSNIKHVVRNLRAHCRGAEVILCADDDVGTARKRNGENIGLEAAHKTAVTHRLRVCSPQIIDNQNTDFNDTHTKYGLEAVRNQLQPQHPDAQIAFAKDIRKRDKKLRKIGATCGRYLPTINQLPAGVTLVRAPQGTGKTHAMRDMIQRYREQGLRVLYVTHRVSLARDAARRLGLDCYEDIPHDYIRNLDGVTSTVNSLIHLVSDDGTLEAWDVVMIDESEQVTAALTGKHIDNKNAVLNAFEHIVRRAGRLVCLDADLGVLTHRLLQHWRPRERYNYISHYHPVGEGRTTYMHSSRDDVYGKLVTLSEPVMCVTNSKREAEALGAYLTSLGRRGRLITSETSSSEASFLADIDSQCEGLDYLVCSPSVSTGVSLEGAHFQHVVGLFYSTVGRPSDAVQALWRVRTGCTYDVWVDPAVRGDYFDLDARYGALREHEQQLLGRELHLESSTTYDDIRRAVEMLERYSQANYRREFLQLVTLQGFNVSFADGDAAHRGLAREARELAQVAYYDAVEHSPKHTKTRDDIRTFYGLTEADVLRVWIEHDNRGRFRKQVERLELGLGDDDHLNAVINKRLETTTMRADMKSLASLREFNRQLLHAVGFSEAARRVSANDPTQLELGRYDKQSLEGFRQWIEHNRSWLGGLVALPTSDKLKTNLIRYIGSWLKSLGLRQTRVGKNVLGQYSLELESLEIACSTIKRRGTVSLDIGLSTKSVPTVSASTSPPSPPPPDWLQPLQTALTRGAFNTINNLETLKTYTEQALAGDGAAIAALHTYIQHPDVQAVLA